MFTQALYSKQLQAAQLVHHMAMIMNHVIKTVNHFCLQTGPTKYTQFDIQPSPTLLILCTMQPSIRNSHIGKV